MPSDADATVHGAGQATAVGQPRWEEIADDIRCPLCEYNLRGLATPRCPECGFAFEWYELLHPSRRPHSYLFEHHGRKRGFASFFRTLVGGLSPGRFWKSLHPAQPVRVWRLICYHALVAGLLSLCVLICVGGLIRMQYLSNARERALLLGRLNNPQGPRDVQFRQRVISRWGSPSAYLDTYLPLSITSLIVPALIKSRVLVVPFLVVLAWAWVTWAALLVFRVSIRRARISLRHMLRCVIYSHDVVIWFALFSALVLCASTAWMALSPWNWQGPLVLSMLLVGCLAMFCFDYRLTVALRDYLRFDRPLATVAAAQFIAALVLFNIYLACVVW